MCGIDMTEEELADWQRVFEEVDENIKEVMENGVDI